MTLPSTKIEETFKQLGMGTLGSLVQDLLDSGRVDDLDEARVVAEIAANADGYWEYFGKALDDLAKDISYRFQTEDEEAS